VNPTSWDLRSRTGAGNWPLPRRQQPKRSSPDRDEKAVAALLWQVSADLCRLADAARTLSPDSYVRSNSRPKSACAQPPTRRTT
jgi:hypothetical protein